MVVGTATVALLTAANAAGCAVRAGDVAGAALLDVVGLGAGRQAADVVVADVTVRTTDAFAAGCGVGLLADLLAADPVVTAVTVAAARLVEHGAASAVIAGVAVAAAVAIAAGVAGPDALAAVVRATSLGDVHTMILYPVMSSHREISPKHRQRMGIRESLVRLSVGIEAAVDIIADLDQALRQR